jgi:hypothetical protein
MVTKQQHIQFLCRKSKVRITVEHQLSSESVPLYTLSIVRYSR